MSVKPVKVEKFISCGALVPNSFPAVHEHRGAEREGERSQQHHQVEGPLPADDLRAILEKRGKSGILE